MDQLLLHTCHENPRNRYENIELMFTSSLNWIKILSNVSDAEKGRLAESSVEGQACSVVARKAGSW